MTSWWLNDEKNKARTKERKERRRGVILSATVAPHVLTLPYHLLFSVDSLNE